METPGVGFMLEPSVGFRVNSPKLPNPPRIAPKKGMKTISMGSSCPSPPSFLITSLTVWGQNAAAGGRWAGLNWVNEANWCQRPFVGGKQTRVGCVEVDP